MAALTEVEREIIRMAVKEGLGLNDAGKRVIVEIMTAFMGTDLALEEIAEVYGMDVTGLQMLMTIAEMEGL